jgi:hypothetical protein
MFGRTERLAIVDSIDFFISILHSDIGSERWFISGRLLAQVLLRYFIQLLLFLQDLLELLIRKLVWILTTAQLFLCLCIEFLEFVLERNKHVLLSSSVFILVLIVLVESVLEEVRLVEGRYLVHVLWWVFVGLAWSVQNIRQHLVVQTVDRIRFGELKLLVAVVINLLHLVVWVTLLASGAVLLLIVNIGVDTIFENCRACSSDEASWAFLRYLV